MGKRLINVDEVEEIVPVLVGKLLENNLITEERKQVIKLFNSGTWYDTLGSLKHLYYERTPKA